MPSTVSARALGRTARQTWVVIHIVASGAWIGIDVMLAVLVGTALLGDPTTAALALQMGPLLSWPLLTAGLVSLLTGVVLGLGSRYGLLRYWWVTVKLVLNVVLVVLVVVLLRPGLDEAAALGAAGGPDPAAGAGTLVFPPVVSLSALLAATVLGVVKPWGRLGPRA